MNNLSIPCVYTADQYALQAAGRTELWGVIRADASGCHAKQSPRGKANPDAHLSASIRRAEAQFRRTEIRTKCDFVHSLKKKKNKQHWKSGGGCQRVGVAPYPSHLDWTRLQLSSLSSGSHPIIKGPVSLEEEVKIGNHLESLADLLNAAHRLLFFSLLKKTKTKTNGQL